ncbi:hypothetical protein BH11ACT1_BH11ACT1_31250 [soil metagenome]
MDNEIDRLARQVADAADAWLRDPLDAHIYARLVRATLDWRVGAQAPVDPALTPPAGDEAVDPNHAAVEPDVVPVERRPKRLDMLLGGFADELRARTVTQPTERTEPTTQPEPTQPV